MSVIVKGMEMPNKCCECNIRYEMFCPLLHRFIADEGRRHNCPLGDVPTPHGKLINADALRAEVKKHATPSDAWVFSLIRTAPTIIEAEGK